MLRRGLLNSLLDRRDQIHQSRFDSAANIDRAAEFGLQRGNISARNVLNVNEITRLRPIAVNLNGVPASDPLTI